MNLAEVKKYLVDKGFSQVDSAGYRYHRHSSMLGYEFQVFVTALNDDVLVSMDLVCDDYHHVIFNRYVVKTEAQIDFLLKGSRLSDSAEAEKLG